MTQDGILELVTKLIKTYPNTYRTYGRSEIEGLTDTWTMALEDYDDDSVMRAFKGFLISDQKGFPPAVGQIVARIPKKATMKEPPSEDNPRRTELKRASSYFPGAIEVGDPRTGEISYVKYEGYPYGEGDKGENNEHREEALTRWFSDLKNNEQNVWKEHGALFGEDMKRWKYTKGRIEKTNANNKENPTLRPDRPGGAAGGLVEADGAI